MIQELGQTELMVVLPQPVSRHMILKSPISPSEVEGKIMLSPKQKEEKVQELLKEMFPDSTMKYQIVATAVDCQSHFKVGSFVSFTQSGNSRPHQMINNGDYMLVSGCAPDNIGTNAPKTVSMIGVGLNNTALVVTSLTYSLSKTTSACP